GIDLEKISTSMTINATASILLALYIAVAKRSGADTRKLSGTVQNDVLKEYIARGTYIYPPRQAMRIITDMFAYANEHLPDWNTISISGYHMREAGCTAVQEVAFTLANAVAYVQAAISAGLAVDKFAPRLSFFFNSHNNFLEEVAKFRAARRMWAGLMKDRFGAKNPRSMMLRFHTKTFDEALGLPTEHAARIALRTQQIIGYETGAPNTIDPLAGSYYIESLTNEIERRAEAYLEKIDALGGTLKAIEQSYIQQEIQNAAYDFQQSVDRLEQVVVGVNRFQTENERAVPIQRIDEDLERRQVERLRALREKRDKRVWQAGIRGVEEAARDGSNVVPHIIQAVESYCTVGEISDAMRRVFGEYQETVVI